MKISVIMAAYNAEKYLAETLESVVHQTIDEYEIIVVNDGSTDKTREILRAYAAQYPILRVLDQENQGPSAARNKGMTVATGEFFFFLDADDVLVETALEALYNRAVRRNADMVIANYKKFNQYGMEPSNNLEQLVLEKNIKRYDRRVLWTFVLWNKLFRADLIREHHLTMPEGISYSEDGVFVLSYLYQARKVTGLNKVVIRHRTMQEGASDSITASIVPWKVEHYIQAHNIMFDLVKESLMRDNPGAESIEALRAENRGVNTYINEFIRKEVQSLLRAFYCKFWQLDTASIELIVEAIKRRLSEADLRIISLLQNNNREFQLNRICVRPEEMLDMAVCTAVLYGEEADKEAFLRSLRSIAGQDLLQLKILVPEHMRPFVQEAGLTQGNILYMDCSSEADMQYRALDEAKTQMMVFCDPRILYEVKTLKRAYVYFTHSAVDFTAQLIYHNGYGKPQPVCFHKMMYDGIKRGIRYDDDYSFDYTLANKFFRTAFLKGLHLDRTVPLAAHIPEIWRRGYSSFQKEGNVLYNDTEASFPAFCAAKCPDPIPAERAGWYEDLPVESLSDPLLAPEPEQYKEKHEEYPMTGNEKDDEKRRKVFDLVKKMKVRNRVLFFTIRSDGKLEGNAKALYPYVKGRKMVCAARLPHSLWTELKMLWLVATSKVIVTDDYCKYLRYMPLKKNQRVIQLWHACGAFKKFGQRGTNLKKSTDLATHAQYNLVAVSGTRVRPIYADAFDINLNKVRALGSPRTDLFFDEKYKAKTVKAILKKHPEFEGKEILLYAPTFRDVNKDRTTFVPELDFDQLSADLLPNQVLLICPHPLMKNEIIPRTYPNIFVCRDFSTNEYMLLSDLMITDYSSVIFEYALLEKPMIFYCYDFNEYNRGFYLRYPEDLPGEVYYTQTELTDYLRRPEMHVPGEKHAAFVREYMTGCDGHSSRRIADIINRYMKEK